MSSDKRSTYQGIRSCLADCHDCIHKTQPLKTLPIECRQYEPTIQLPSTILKEINTQLIKSSQKQIDDCTGAIEFLHERLNAVQVDVHLGKNLKRNLILNIQRKIESLDLEIFVHMKKIKQLNGELCPEHMEALDSCPAHPDTRRNQDGSCPECIKTDQIVGSEKAEAEAMKRAQETYEEDHV